MLYKQIEAINKSKLSIKFPAFLNFALSLPNTFAISSSIPNMVTPVKKSSKLFMCSSGSLEPYTPSYNSANEIILIPRDLFLIDFNFFTISFFPL